jgi:hypothetical protein
MDLDYLMECIQQEGHLQQLKTASVERAYHTLTTTYENLNHFAHCRQRYIFHNEGQHLAKNQIECLEKQAANYSFISKLTSAAETDFFFLANERLVSSRKILKNSYCVLYHKLQHEASTETKEDVHDKLEITEGMACSSENAMSIDLAFSPAFFRDHQERLERLTEHLSNLCENALTPDDRQRVVEVVSFHR